MVVRLRQSVSHVSRAAPCCAQIRSPSQFEGVVNLGVCSAGAPALSTNQATLSRTLVLTSKQVTGDALGSSQASLRAGSLGVHASLRT